MTTSDLHASHASAAIRWALTPSALRSFDPHLDAVRAAEAQELQHRHSVRWLQIPTTFANTRLIRVTEAHELQHCHSVRWLQIPTTLPITLRFLSASFTSYLQVPNASLSLSPFPSRLAGAVAACLARIADSCACDHQEFQHLHIVFCVQILTTLPSTRLALASDLAVMPHHSNDDPKTI